MSNPLPQLDEGVTFAEGFLAAGVRCGLKPEGPDLALIFSTTPASVAGVFTTSCVRAAPVRQCETVVAGGSARAIVVNAGNANAVTGPQGEADTAETAKLVAQNLHIGSDEVLVASTGVIGYPLDMSCIRAGVPAAIAELHRGDEAARRAILTTDLVPKSCGVEVELRSGSTRIGGICKGSGMIAPNMATMLAFVTTDAAVDSVALQALLQEAVEPTFNSITVDGDCSTNDSVLLLANAASGVGLATDADVERFGEGLRVVLESLARQIVRDGEGATREIEIHVTGSASSEHAKHVAMTVANSPLVKTAFHSGEPNWGRLMMAVGRAGGVVEAQLQIDIGELAVVRNGRGVLEDLDALTTAMLENPARVHIDLGLGDAAWRVWTCDLSKDYVEINASYIS